MTTEKTDLNDLFLSKFQNTQRSNLAPKALVAHALTHEDGKLTADGTLDVSTGIHTGRSPKDKFFVRDKLTQDSVWWDNAGSMSDQQFGILFDDMLAHAAEKSTRHAANGSPIAKEALDRIGAFYKTESNIRGKPPDERRQYREAIAPPPFTR